VNRIRQYGFIPGLIICLGLSAFYSWNWYNQAQLHQAVRVHFIANSDRPTDQRLKLQVRDTVLKTLAPAVASSKGRQEVVSYIGANLPQLEAEAKKEIARQGYSYPVQVAIGEKNYGWRTSGGIIFSPGSYTALTVTIGQGQGHNWWGVLYPPFCLVSEDNNQSGIELRCKLWDMASELKGKVVSD